MSDENDLPIQPDDLDVSEEIDAQEVDEVIAALGELMEKVKSDTVRAYLEDTCADIAYLVAEDDDEEEFEDDDEDEDFDEDFDDDEEFEDEEFDDEEDEDFDDDEDEDDFDEEEDRLAA